MADKKFERLEFVAYNQQGDLAMVVTEAVNAQAGSRSSQGEGRELMTTSRGLAAALGLCLLWVHICLGRAAPTKSILPTPPANSTSTASTAPAAARPSCSSMKNNRGADGDMNRQFGNPVTA